MPKAKSGAPACAAPQTSNAKRIVPRARPTPTFAFGSSESDPPPPSPDFTLSLNRHTVHFPLVCDRARTAGFSSGQVEEHQRLIDFVGCMQDS